MKTLDSSQCVQTLNCSPSASIFRLSESQSQQAEQSKGLQQRLNELKSSLSSSQLEVSQCMAQYDSLMEQHQTLDLTMTKLDNHCEVSARFSETAD